MVVVTLNNRHHGSIGSLLVFMSHHMKEEKVDHPRFLCGYEDKFENLCSENHPEHITRPVFCVNPMTPKCVFSWKNCQYRITFTRSDGVNLYKNPEHSNVFEPVYTVDIEVDGHDTMPIQELLLHSLQYTQKWDTYQNSPKDITVFHWVDEYWGKLNSVEKRDISTIYLPNNETEKIVKDIERFLANDTKKLYSEFGIPYHRTYCLHGPPGTGKSSLIFALVSKINKHIGVLSLSKKTDDQSFVRALNTVPKNTILLLEDIDCLLGERIDKNSQITFSALLNTLDGVQSKHGLVTFITTNYFLNLDPAFCRPGRIDYVLEFSYATKSQIFIMLEKFFPHQSEKFERFYQEMKGLKVTTCILQKHLFQRFPDQDILSGLDQLRKDVEMSKFEKQEGKMYI